MPESGSAHSLKLQINFNMNEVHVTQNQEQQKYQAPQKALLSTIHPCFLLEKTYSSFQKSKQQALVRSFALLGLFLSTVPFPHDSPYLFPTK